MKTEKIKNQYFLLFMCLVALIDVFAQGQSITLNDSTVIGIVQKKSDKDKINDIFLPFGWVDYNAEFYSVDSKTSYIDHHFVYQPYVGTKQVFQIELGMVDSQLESGNFLTPGDLVLSFQQKIEPEKVESIGFQGFALLSKFTIPTGRREFLSGDNSWAVEPQVAAQWSVFSEDWLISGIARYKYFFASLPDKNTANNHIRFESYFGYENEKWWAFMSLDYRYISNTSTSTTFLGIVTGYKLSRRFLLNARYKPRLSGSDFYKRSLSFGGTMFF